MLFSYQADGSEYIVRGDEPAQDTTELEVSFVARVNGGRGRMPKPKTVPVDQLQVLVCVDMETAKKALQNMNEE